MTARSSNAVQDRILLSSRGRNKAARQTARRRSIVWRVAGGLVLSTVLLWVMVQLGQASTNTKEKGGAPPAASTPSSAGSPASVDSRHDSDTGDGQQPKTLPAKAAQGPALNVPREVLDMLDSRKLDLDRREQEVRQSEERLEMVRAEIEKLLAQNEALEKRLQSERAKESQQETNTKTVQAKALLEKERLASEKKSQLGRMYETMPSEEAAVRLERMSDPSALEILRLVKPKTAGAILGQVKPERAAKLTEQLLAESRQEMP